MDPQPHRIPGRLNLFLLAATAAACCVLLRVASHSSWPVVLGAAVAFSFVNNTMFSLLHEAVHGIGHQNATVNAWMGRIAAAFFPTSYSLQRIFHLGHHARNRSEFEQFDYIRPGDHRVLKYLQWYSILTGLYWLFVPAGGLLYLLWPGVFTTQRLRSRSSELAAQTGAASMFAGMETAPRWTIRGELLLTIAVQSSFFLFLGVTFQGWLACYAAFAINWSSLQYTDHAFSKLDVREGAWNLRVHPLIRALFLNYHHHQAHHIHPTVPWTDLGGYVDPAGEQSFWKIYFEMWRGPKPLPAESDRT